MRARKGLQGWSNNRGPTTGQSIHPKCHVGKCQCNLGKEAEANIDGKNTRKHQPMNFERKEFLQNVTKGQAVGQGCNTCKGSNTSPTGVLRNST